MNINMRSVKDFGAIGDGEKDDSGAIQAAIYAARIAQLEALLREAQSLRPQLLKQFGHVPEYVLDYCNKVRAAL